MFTTRQKLELCGISYYLDDYPELFERDNFDTVVIRPYDEKLPLVSNYAEILFSYGKHLYSIKQNLIKDREDASFSYCFNLLKEYRLLLTGNKPYVSIPNSKNRDRISKGKSHISDESYRKILMAGFEAEMRKYNLHHIAKPDEQISQEMEDRINDEWVDNCMRLINKSFPNYPIEEKTHILFNSYALAFPNVVAQFSLKHVDFMIDRGLKVNEERNYIKTPGRPAIEFEKECMEKLFSLLIVDFVTAGDDELQKEKIIQTNDTIRYEFIYDYLYFFRIYTTEIDKNCTTGKSGLIKSLIGKRQTRKQEKKKN